jgi:DNA-binding transcriptional MerR regulator
MRMSELSERSGVPVATIKYYLREGLLHAGASRSATQATYDDDHVERLRLVRVLREIGQVPVAAVGAVLAAVDDPSLPLAEVIALAHHGLGPTPPDRPSDDHRRARAEVEAFIRSRGWHVESGAPAIDALAAALVALQGVVGPCSAEAFIPYADAADELARFELAWVDPTQSVGNTIGQIVVGTVVYEQALVALRRLAEEHYSGERFGRRAAPASTRGRRATRGAASGAHANGR